jgi:hypothetical protein
MVGMADEEKQTDSGGEGGIPEETNEEGGIIFVLEKASLEVAKVGKVFFCVTANSWIGLYTLFMT